MERIATSIMKKAEKLAEGTLISAKTLLTLGSRGGVDQALSRLTRRGKLMRVSRGMYVLPVTGRFGKRAPSAEKVIESLAAQRGERVVQSIATAANALGLTTQVPVRSIYLTSGRNRKLTLGNLNVELRHAPSWQLRSGQEGEVVRALAWAGPERAEETFKTLSARTAPSVIEDILQTGPSMPSWMINSMIRQYQYA